MILSLINADSLIHVLCMCMQIISSLVARAAPAVNNSALHYHNASMVNCGSGSLEQKFLSKAFWMKLSVIGAVFGCVELKKLTQEEKEADVFNVLSSILIPSCWLWFAQHDSDEWVLLLSPYDWCTYYDQCGNRVQLLVLRCVISTFCTDMSVLV